MAFQVRDDILDLCGTEKELGKPPGSDIRQGNLSIPVIFALQEEPLKESLLQEINRIQQLEGQTDISGFIRTIRASNGIKRAEDMASRYIDKAIAALQPLPNIQAKKDYVGIAHFIGNRSY
jgi:heptaprenyl diphosphate synthase